MIKKLFTPNLMLDKLEDFNCKEFIEKGFNTILLDIDNTLVPAHTPDPDERTFKMIKKFKDAGFRVIIYSNNTKKRVSRFVKDLDVEWYFWSFKPLLYIYLRIFIEKKIDKKKVIGVGDQLVTDVFGCNKAGVYSVYVKPITTVEQFTTYINRFFERLIFKYVLK